MLQFFQLNLQGWLELCPTDYVFVCLSIQLPLFIYYSSIYPDGWFRSCDGDPSWLSHIFRWVAQSPSRSGPKTSQNPENLWISYKSTGSSIHRHIMTYLPIQHDSFDSQGIHRYPLVHWHLGLALRVDLDIKKHASIENISPSPEVAEAEAPGDAGECCSWWRMGESWEALVKCNFRIVWYLLIFVS